MFVFNLVGGGVFLCSVIGFWLVLGFFLKIVVLRVKKIFIKDSFWKERFRFFFFRFVIFRLFDFYTMVLSF